MHEIEYKVKDICEMKDRLICQVKSHVEQGVFCEGIDGEAVGEVVDMIKDLCEAEYYLSKSCYYKCIMKEMESETAEGSEMMGYPRVNMNSKTHMRGYDTRRYASSGRFAPKGKGEYYGYTPSDYDPTRGMEEDTNRYMGKYGYPMDDRYSMAYNEYADAKRHYHESKDPMAKHEMEEHANEHLDDTLKTTKDIWMDAKPEKQREFKKNMMDLLKDIPS